MDKAQIQARLSGSMAHAVLMAVAFWPVWSWYILRTFDRSDEPWGLLALATAIYFVAHAGKISSESPGRSRGNRAVAAVLLAAYTFAFSVTPHLVQGIIMVAVLWFWFGSKLKLESRWGILGLLFLSLPIVPSINFFAGFPLRLLVAQAAKLMLGCLGIAAMKQGTLLYIGGKPVSIDAPCSGISMLWVGLYSAMVLACYFKLSARRTAVLTVAGAGLVLLANAVRAVALIMFDRVCQMPRLGVQVSAFEPVVHVGIGVIAFGATAAAMALIAMKLSAFNSGNAGEHSHPVNLQQAIDKANVSPSNQHHGIDEASISPSNQHHGIDGAIVRPGNLRLMSSSNLLLGSLCICAAAIPFLAHTTGGAALNTKPPAWPTEILGHSVTAVQVLDEERAFAADFPGHMRRFTDGTNSYFVRVVDKETRQLHPSSDCFKGMGYSIEPQPLVVSSDGTRWSAFLASKGSARYLIMEQLHDSHGHIWTDVSEWYWHALMNESDGPWWDITAALPH